MSKVFKGSWLRNTIYLHLGQRTGDKTGFRNKGHRQKHRQVDIFWIDTPQKWILLRGIVYFAAQCAMMKMKTRR